MFSVKLSCHALNFLKLSSCVYSYCHFCIPYTTPHSSYIVLTCFVLSIIKVKINEVECFKKKYLYKIQSEISV